VTLTRFISPAVLALSLALTANQTQAADLNYTGTIAIEPGQTKTIFFRFSARREGDRQGKIARRTGERPYRLSAVRRRGRQRDSGKTSR
jgi:hypothetical protein